MPFTIDEDTLLIKGRKGDTAEFTFSFDQDISEYTVGFYVKKNISDAVALIEKEFVHPVAQSVTVNLTVADTDNLVVDGSAYGTYFWGLKIGNGTTFAQTIIPQEFKTAPQMRIYPEIGED